MVINGCYILKRDEKVKKITITSLLVLFIFLTGCGQKQEVLKSYTYSDLSEEQQVVVDKVLDLYEKWDSVHDSGKEFGCTNVAFFKERGIMLFATGYKFHPEDPSTAFACMIFKVDMQTGKLSGHSYSLYGDDPAWERSATVRALTGSDFSTSFSLEQMRDVLADEYYKATME